MRNNKTNRHSERQDLIGEHAIGDLGQIILLVIFMIIWIIDSFFLKISTFLNDQIPNSIRTVIGLTILFISGYFAKKGLGIIFGQVRNNPEVIDTSVFNIVRHPIYLGSILFYLGLIILTSSIASSIIWVFIVIFYYYISRYEEKLLLNEFGIKYKKYMERVPMLIPKLYRKFQ